ncbi:protease inhibitor I42 family protein [Methanocella sp. MCL-LM]|uniref:protease inhibitor I42 family protein n=1 Tax=Methanocella sp. MCL-LM TaxID=3412035 RepID=UPI003C785BA4
MKFRPKVRQKKVPTFSIQDHRTTVGLQPGDRFVIRLPVNLELGYRWNPDLPPGLKVVDSWFGPTDLARPFAGGFHYWKIRAIAPGMHFYRANYRGQNKTGDILPITFQLQVDVSPE